MSGCSAASGPVTVEIAGGSAPALLSSAPPTQPPPPTRAQPIVWESSEPEARARARRGSRPLIVWVRAEWAASALEMERRTWVDPRVAQAARGFVALRLDVTEAEGDAELYARRYGVAAMPTTLVFDAGGREVAALRGYADADAVVAALAKATE